MLSKVLTLKNLKVVAYFAAMAGMLLFMAHYAIPHALAQTGGGANIDDNPELVRGWTSDAMNFRSLARSIVNFFLYFLGFIATVMIIYAGVQYVTAQGEQDKIDGAKKIITYAVIGIVVILISFAIVNTVLYSAQPNAEPAI